MAVSRVGEATVTVAAGGTSTSITTALPPGVASGDVLILELATGLGPYTVPDPAGWTYLQRTGDLGTAPAEAALTTWWKVAAASEMAPSLTSPTATRWHTCIRAFRGVDNAAPFLSQSGRAETGASTTTVHTAPALSNTDAGAWGLYTLASRQVATPYTATPGAGLTERVDIDTGVAGTSNLMYYGADSGGPVAAGSVTYSATASGGSAISAMWAALLKPAAAGGTAATAAGAVTLGGTAAPVAPGAAGGSIGLGGGPAASGQVVATGGTLSLNGAPAATAPATSGGTIDLDGATTGQAAGSTALTLYLTSTNSTTVSTGRTLVGSAPAASTSVGTQVGKATGWGDLAPQGKTTAWPAASTQPPMGSAGLVFVYETDLTGQQILAGSYTPTIRLGTSATLTADIVVRVGVLSAGGAYTVLATCTAPATRISSAGAVNYAIPAGTAVGYTFATGDRLALDVDLNVTTASSSSTCVVSLYENGGAPSSVITPGLAAAPGTPATAAGVISLGGAVQVAASAAAGGGLTLGGSATPTTPATASGAVSLGGAPTARGASTAAGTVTLAGAAAAGAAPVSAGTVTLSGAATGTQPGNTATGTLTLGGTAAGRSPASGGGPLTLTGATTTKAPASTAGGVTLTGAASAPAASAATGNVTLGGAATGRASAPAGGAVALGGATTAQVLAIATGTIILGGVVPARAPTSTTGAVILGGAVTARVSATAAGAITLNGLANAQAHINLPPLTGPVTAAFASDGATTGGFVTSGITTGAFASHGITTGTFTSDGVGVGSFA